MTALIASPIAQALALALVHFAWQGTVIGLAAWIGLRVLRVSATARYTVGIVMLAAMLLVPVATFVRLLDASPARFEPDTSSIVTTNTRRLMLGELTTWVAPATSSDRAASAGP